MPSDSSVSLRNVADLQGLLDTHPGQRFKRLIQAQQSQDRQAYFWAMHEDRWRLIRESPVRWDKPLPPGYGLGHDERVIEIPLALEVARLDRPGLALDAGAALNHPNIDALALGWQARLVHYTQVANREWHLKGDRRAYMFGDLRALEFRDDAFDRIVCISTLEHIGLDNSRYGGARETDPSSADAAWREMLRVLKPGGTLFLSVPYAVRPSNHGWFRNFGAEDVWALVSGLNSRTRLFHYDQGWHDGPPTTLDPDEPINGLAVIRVGG